MMPPKWRGSLRPDLRTQLLFPQLQAHGLSLSSQAFALAVLSAKEVTAPYVCIVSLFSSVTSLPPPH